MAKRAENEGFRMLDDFVCEAIHDPSIPLAKPENQGRNEGILVVEEIVFDVASKAASLETDSQRRVVPISGAASSLDTSWARLFEGAAAGAAAATFTGIVGGILHVFGAVAGLKETRDAEKGCQLCGRADAAYSLRCCHSIACENCLSKMFNPQREEGVGFRCALCGHVHTDGE